ncbi:hypothetical protein BB559_000138 [Furculomyces boomerangus]|uniref:Pru domain-containing protein n=1 Tax=Furculomyces boomerangus TaxID=61424 RepID=A0A2T9Z6A5_9FUNG|nr:hypothetical protein BB559_000138 [Furculomyces boomerangus]
MATPLFSKRQTNQNEEAQSINAIIQFNAGRCFRDGSTEWDEDGMFKFSWRELSSSEPEDVWVIFPGDVDFKKVAQSNGRVFVLKFHSSPERLFFWIQEKDESKDEKIAKTVSQTINGSIEDMNNIDDIDTEDELMETVLEDDSTPSSNRNAGSSTERQEKSTDPTFSEEVASAFSHQDEKLALAQESGKVLKKTLPSTQVGGVPSNMESPSLLIDSQNDLVPPIGGTRDYLDNIGNLLANIQVPPNKRVSPLELSRVMTPEVLLPLLNDEKLCQSLFPTLPDQVPKTREEIERTINSPQFTQALHSLGYALESGQMVSLAHSFGLPPEALTSVENFLYYDPYENNLDDFDDLNDETFGATASEIQKDFDFYVNTIPNNGFPEMHGFNEPTNVSAHQINIDSWNMNSQNFQSSFESNIKSNVLTLEEIESQMIREIKNKIPKDEIIRIRNERRANQKNRDTEMKKYNGLMTQHDKDYVLRSQISQLVSEDNLAESFYSHMYDILRSQKPSSLNNFPVHSSKEAIGKFELNRVHQQVQRMINDARKRKPKTTQTVLEGTLGKITAKTSRNPKQAIQIEKTDSVPTNENSVESNKKDEDSSAQRSSHYKRGMSFSATPETDKRKTLQLVEIVYEHILVLEQILRDNNLLDNGSNESQNWVNEYKNVKTKLWNKLELDQPVSSEFPHPFVRILSIPKGKRIIPRIVHHLNPDQVLAMVTTLVANFESLDVCKINGVGMGRSSELDDNTLLFMMSVMPSILSYISEAPLTIVNGLLALLMDRNSIVWVARTKPGLVLITLLLSRAEVLKQHLGSQNYSSPKGSMVSPTSLASNEQANKASLFRYLELYNLMFRTLQNHITSLLPSPYSTRMSASQISVETAAEDGYIWQFFASLGVAANVDQQHILVALVRDSILDRVQMSNKTGLNPESKRVILGNVNLFLNSLGLDSSQITL